MQKFDFPYHIRQFIFFYKKTNNKDVAKQQGPIFYNFLQNDIRFQNTYDNLENYFRTRPRGFKKSCSSARREFFMLISTKISRNTAFLESDKPMMLLFLLKNVELPTVFGN